MSFEGENKEREYISGVSIIQEKWHPAGLGLEKFSTESFDVVKVLMSEVGEKTDDSEDLQVVHQIIEEAAADYRSKYYGREFREEVRGRVAKRLDELYYREYCRLVWNGSICHTVEVMNCYPSGRELKITSGTELKRSAEEDFFRGYSNRRWVGVNSAFRLGMLRFPEIMTVIKLREYFDAMAGLLEAKTVFESDMMPNPIHIFGGPVYDSEKISNRLGTRLVRALQHFGYCLRDNRCFEAECELEKILQLQDEVCKITDQKIKVPAKEALEILNQNMYVLKAYFDSWGYLY